jgi:hypothetical protein
MYRIRISQTVSVGLSGDTMQGRQVRQAENISGQLDGLGVKYVPEVKWFQPLTVGRMDVQSSTGDCDGEPNLMPSSLRYVDISALPC